MVRLETERLIVRDYRETDLENLHKLLSDRENMYYLDDISTNTFEETAQNFEYASSNADGHYFAVCDRTSGAYIGSVGYTIKDETPIGKIVHMGFFILPNHQGKGYTTEAVRSVIEFAFKKDNCIRVTTGCYRDNAASRRVMEKVGFRKEGERIKAAWHDGRMKDRLDYAINIDDFYNQGS